jgi:hypothetical protein
VNACPVCGSTDVHEERVYTIRGQRVTIRFAACLHTPEEIARQTKAGAAPPLNL